jgi:2'-hydroxyisoflavone reductase
LEKTMKILILGGTVFLGRVIVEAALAHGHELTLFNRGRSNPSLFQGVEEIFGDRTMSLEPLQGRRFDAVIDTSGYLPGVVRRSVEAFSANAGQYTFISSISVYASFEKIGLVETDPLAELKDASSQEVTNENYGPLKALCEETVSEVFAGRALNIRPGLIVGPYDPTDRLTYWPWRIAGGGEVLAPGRPSRPTQFIDVRDLAGWIVLLIEKNATGVYNATGPAQPLPMGELLESCRQISGSSANLLWVSEDLLLEHQVVPWSELPLWVPESDPGSAGLFKVDISKALQDGLTFRSLEETIRTTLAWANTRTPDHAWRAGLTREREAELMAAYKTTS